MAVGKLLALKAVWICQPVLNPLRCFGRWAGRELSSQSGAAMHALLAAKRAAYGFICPSPSPRDSVA